MQQTAETLVDVETVYYIYELDGDEYATPDYNFAMRRANGMVYVVRYNQEEINAPECA